MILGKFMPPHLGHQYLIDFARSRADHLTIIVGTLEKEPIPGRLRFEWVRELYPDLRVVHLTDENPSEPHEHPRFWDIWTASLRRILPDGVDYVFTSENYGDELARRLGARHVLVDLARARVHVSATMIRERPYDNWQYIPECARPYFVKRVVIIGPESTGKTTLACKLAEHYNTVWVPEFAREYLDMKDAPCELSDIPRFVEGQIESEEQRARKANRVLFCDTDVITTAVWSDYLFNECPDWIKQKADERTYDLYLLTDIDVPWVVDPQRFCPEERDYFLKRFRRELESRNRPYTIISGSYDERLQRAICAVDALFIR